MKKINEKNERMCGAEPRTSWHASKMYGDTY